MLYILHVEVREEKLVKIPSHKKPASNTLFTLRFQKKQTSQLIRCTDITASMFKYIKFDIYISSFIQLKISSYADVGKACADTSNEKGTIHYFTMSIFNDRISLQMTGQLRACFINILIIRRNEQFSQLITRNYLFIHDRDRAASSSSSSL